MAIRPIRRPAPQVRLTIPEIRKRMDLMAQRLDTIVAWAETQDIDELPQDLKQMAGELRFLSDQSKRRQHQRRGRIKHPPLTEETKRQIRAYARTHPTAHLQDIAVVFGTNSGRVSETLHGKR